MFAYYGTMSGRTASGTLGAGKEIFGYDIED